MKPRHKQFADEYLKCGNAAEAYRAVYGDKSTGVSSANGSRLLSSANVRAYIEERMAAQDAERVASADEVLAYLTRVLRRKTRSEIVVVEGLGTGISAARRVRKAPDERDRLKAAELLGRYHAIYADKLKVDAVTPVVLVHDLEGGHHGEHFLA
jgi:phage terminase small subunit